MHEKPAEACAASRTRPSSARCGRSPRERRSGRLRREHGRHAGRLAARACACRASCGLRSPSRSRLSAARPCCSTAARTRTPGRSTCCSSRTWAQCSRRRFSASSGPRCGCSRSARSPRRGIAHARGARAARRERPALRRQRRGRDLLAGAADVVVCDGFTGNIALKLLEGTIHAAGRRRAEITATLRSACGLLIGRPCAACARGSIPTPTAAPITDAGSS